MQRASLIPESVIVEPLQENRFDEDELNEIKKHWGNI